MACYKFLGLICLILIQALHGCTADPPDRIRIVTDLGSIEVEIYSHDSPVTAGNFLSLVKRDAYGGALFYRVVRMDNQPHNQVKIEVIQGGLLHEKRIDQYKSIKHETTDMTGIKHLDGVISMARNDPGSASTEFFICVGDQPSLDYGGDRNPDGEGFAAFGRVTKGMDIVKAIQMLPDSVQMLVEPVLIHRIEIIRHAK